MRPTRLLGTGVLAVTILALTPTAAPAETARSVLDGVLAGGQYQTEMPDTPETSDAPSPLEPRSPPKESYSGSVGETLLWVLIAAAAVLLVAFLVKLAREWRPEAVVADAAVTLPTGDGAPVASRSLAAADRLAAAGDFGEAVHVLLLSGLDALRRSRAAAATASLTSREVLQRAALPEAASSALSHLVATAELSHFGGRAMSQGDYRVCRDAYVRLAATAIA